MKYRVKNAKDREIYLIEDYFNIFRFFYKDVDYVKCIADGLDVKSIEFEGSPVIKVGDSLKIINEGLPEKYIKGLYIDHDRESYFMEVEDKDGKDKLYEYLKQKAEIDACHALADFYDE
jgi:hypothetical protein